LIDDVAKSLDPSAPIEARGATLMFLPAYSPDLNPIEKAFAKLKQLIRSATQLPSAVPYQVQVRQLDTRSSAISSCKRVRGDAWRGTARAIRDNPNSGRVASLCLQGHRALATPGRVPGILWRRIAS